MCSVHHTQKSGQGIIDRSSELKTMLTYSILHSKTTGKSPFVNENEGNLSITAKLSNSSSGHQPVSLHAALALFGDLSSFSANHDAGYVSIRCSMLYLWMLTSNTTTQATFDVSYYDARDATNAKKYLNGRSILGMDLRAADELDSEGNRSWPVTAQPDASANSEEIAVVPSESSDVTPTKVENEPPRHIVTPLSPASTVSIGHNSPQKAHFIEEETSPVLYRTPISLEQPPHLVTSPVKRTKKSLLPSASVSNLRVRTLNTPIHPQQSTPSPLMRIVPPRLSLPWLNASMPGGPLHQKPPHMTPNFAMFNAGAGRGGGPATRQSSPRSFATGQTTPYHSQNNSTSTAESTTDSGPATPSHTFGHGHSPALSKAGSFEHLPQESPIVLSPGMIRGGPLHSGGNRGIPERNSVDISRIEVGLDTRTTVMLKVRIYELDAWLLIYNVECSEQNV